MLAEPVNRFDEDKHINHELMLSLISKMKESELKVVELKCCSANIMELLLDCIYTDKVEFNTENVQELLAAASLFQLPGAHILMRFSN
jgi:hypothetical protein